MEFKVISRCFNNASVWLHSGRDCDFYLEEDGWNDYHYYTMYHLHATCRLTGGTENEYIGYIRIMKIGQEQKESNLVRAVTQGRVFSSLPDDFVSLSLNVSLFKRLHQILDAQKRQDFVEALHVIISPASPLLEKVVRDDCFINSLLRDDASVNGFHMRQIESYMLGKSAFYDLRQEAITVHFSHVENPVDLKFVCRDDYGKDDFSKVGLPDGVVVFVGKNGSGKSTAMYKLARLIHSDPTLRFSLKESLGEISPSDIGVNKLLIFSYTPFDNFYLPGMDEAQLLSQLKNLEYEDCSVLFNGIRDMLSEMEQRAKNAQGIPEDGRVETICLKPNEALCSEFLIALKYIETAGANREQLWNGFLSACQLHQQNLHDDLDRIISAPEESKYEEFAKTATGHKFIIHSIARLIAYIEENSLVLFDEPENHLHPPLLSFYYARVRKIIDSYSSVAFIATHSPVIVQETFSRNVNIVRRLDGKTLISQPQIETYGATITSITTEVFDLTTDKMNTYNVFRRVFEKEMLDLDEKPEQVIEDFKKAIGGEISGPMESYLLKLYFDKKAKDVEA